MLLGRALGQDWEEETLPRSLGHPFLVLTFVPVDLAHEGPSVRFMDARSSDYAAVGATAWGYSMLLRPQRSRLILGSYVWLISYLSAHLYT